ncbi:hypothetical protein PRIPAC_96855 [Pristionchus pacificus]|uniref:Uncharacterized protein n=1 Tax=Pristionchus pacificus TaxID=54126 RepID=A0A2A6BDP1_PRIPA|nr:hypothetical protein PRIPAC_96855 [Pristionchus pacificus]|eukprot:PDM64007.1 hypothetical protein PRIPAC_49508 [Pristionchus pacificus]
MRVGFGPNLADSGALISVLLQYHNTTSLHAGYLLFEHQKSFHTQFVLVSGDRLHLTTELTRTSGLEPGLNLRIDNLVNLLVAQFQMMRIFELMRLKHVGITEVF